MDSRSIKAVMINAISRKRKELDKKYHNGLDAAINAVANLNLDYLDDAKQQEQKK